MLQPVRRAEQGRDFELRIAHPGISQVFELLEGCGESGLKPGVETAFGCLNRTECCQSASKRGSDSILMQLGSNDG